MASVQIYKDLVFMVQKIIGKNTTTEHTLTAAGKHIFGDDYEGTFAIDEVPKTPFKYAIVNVDARRSGGSHWVAVAHVDNEQYMVYDSFGRKTAKLLPTLDLQTIDTEHDAEQTSKEKNCGARVLAWLMLFDSFGPQVAQTI